MLTIVKAIAEHSYRIMFFRHDGSGLPTKKGGALYLLLAVSVLARLLRDVADPSGFSAAVSVITCAIYMLLALVMLSPVSTSALLLANMFGCAVVGALHLGGISHAYINHGVMLWETVAFMVVLNKIVRHAQANHKKQSSSKK